MDADGVYAKYRQWNPASILGIRIYYNGWGGQARPEPDLTEEDAYAIREVVDKMKIDIPAPPAE